MRKLILFLMLIFISYGCRPRYAVNEFPKFDAEGHRGCRGLMPENTIPAMLHAIDLNVTTLEMDVHITKDSQVVVSHDAWFNPDITTKPDGSNLSAGNHGYILFNMNYDSICKYDVGLKLYDKFPQQKKLQVSKPLLNDLIDSVETYCKAKRKIVQYNIEIKSSAAGDNIYHPDPAKFTDLVMAVIYQKKIEQRVIVQSFDFRSLQYLHSKYPGIRTSALVGANDKRSLQEIITALGFRPAIYSTEYTLVTDTLINDCHKDHILIIPWTVNNLAEMKRLKNMGVDGLISDYPNLYKSL
ncbi:MAG TPA: glycerophosphodiester phosphodiesterase family protein [Parafilimonas sp.]|nr:glycerophosphodiester phosphodiesterase family protein [Parafilimonas sp.]